ncbi:unnamed protein product [Oikopleura dioica]|uniref:BTBD10/KCTD20 BTB/POZ domain-containing protein n=1 Tax=Oikopleura dioica TaxID=34765 RepID=E4XC39_OIKDI|nr:unnamed protein product [Oikopleura dioica]
MNDFDDRASLTSSLSSKSTSDIGETLSTPTRIQRSPMKKLTLIVDKTRFICSTAIFQSQPETLLGKMFSAGLLKPGAVSVQLNEHGEYVFTENISAPVFKAILDYYTGGIIQCPPGISLAELRETCDYFLIPFNSETVQCENLADMMHELSNLGARDEFTKLLKTLIIPKLVEASAVGDREIRLVVLHDEDIIDWDKDFPPLSEEERQSLYTVVSSKLSRFAKYIENREVAKQVLVDRGFKKIRLGIEGYPTTKERVKQRRGKSHVSYNFVQRSFITLSWEKEEHRSRHVDFQCVKSKSSSNLPEVVNLENNQDADFVIPRNLVDVVDGVAPRNDDHVVEIE